MLRRKHLFKAVLSLGALAAVARLFGRRADAWEYGGTMAEPATEPVPTPYPRPRPRPAARMTTVAALTVIFFAGASFTAVAGDQAASLLEGSDAAETALEPEDSAAADEALAAEASLPAEETQGAPAPESTEGPAPESTGGSAPESAAPAPESTEADPAAEPAPTADAVANVDPALAHELADQGPATEVAALSVTAESVAPAAAPVAAGAARATAKLRAPQPKPSADDGPAAPKQRNWVTTRAKAPPAREPEIDHGDSFGEPTVWLNRSLPDPTPASKRLAPKFAKELRAAARRHDADWAAVLGVLRAQGSRGAAPATVAELDTLAGRLAGRDTWRAALALSGRTEFADRAEALRDYYKAVGLRALVKGLKVSKERLVKRLLKDERVWIYWGGQSDLEADRIDVRLVVLILYLAERHDSVTVSSLFSGHRKYARPGVVSAHTYGQAVDIAAVGGTSVLGNSQPGGMTEEAVRSILLLPAELQPQQVISLLGLGGPSFPLADHADHIHVGY
jgi:hypothetical protein